MKKAGLLDSPPTTAAQSPWLKLGRLLCWLGVALLLARSLTLLQRDPCIGVADNLDYWRVAKPAGIKVHAVEKQGFFMSCGFDTGKSDLASAFSSAALIAWTARYAPLATDASSDRFDLRQVGLVYWLGAAAIVVGALALGLPEMLVLLLTWVLVDPGFLLFFNSLYAEPAMLVGLLLALCALLLGDLDGRRRGMVRSGGLAMGGAIVGFSKMHFAVFPAVLALTWAAALWAARRRSARSELCALALLSISAVWAPAHFLWGSGPRFPDANNYNAVFGGIARVSSDPAAALGALGIPEAYRQRSTRDYFAGSTGADDPVIQPLRQLSRLRLARLYLEDPSALRRTGTAIADLLLNVGTNPRGNYTHAESGASRRVFETPEQFSLWRARLLALLPAYSLWLLLAALGAVLVYRLSRRRWSAADAASFLLLAWLVAQAMLAVLGEGLVNLEQHLVGARVALDLLLVLVLYRLSASCARLVRKRSRGAILLTPQAAILGPDNSA